MKTRRLLPLVILAALGTLLMPGWSVANLITNPSFEAVPIGPPFVSSDPADIPGWTHDGSGGDGLLWAIGFNDGFGSITTAGDGNQFVTLGGGFAVAALASWSQTLSITPGLYDLTFKMASERGEFGQSLTVDFPAGSSTPAQTFSALPSSALYWRDWELKAETVTVTGNTLTIRFFANTLQDVGLDAVDIEPHVVSTVPEPSTFLLLGSGLVGLVGVAWRWQRK